MLIENYKKKNWLQHSVQCIPFGIRTIHRPLSINQTSLTLSPRPISSSCRSGFLLLLGWLSFFKSSRYLVVPIPKAITQLAQPKVFCQVRSNAFLVSKIDLNWLKHLQMPNKNRVYGLFRMIAYQHTFNSLRAIHIPGRASILCVKPQKYIPV